MREVRSGRSVCLLAAAAGLLPGSAGAHGQLVERPEPVGAAPTEQAEARDRPETSRRIVAEFDFENVFAISEGLPSGWVRAQNDPLVPRIRPGYPLSNLAELDRRLSHQGVASMKLPTSGGSTSLRLEPGVLPVFPSADYRISAMVRTAALEHARARLSAVLLDGQREPIAGSESLGPLMETAGGWEPVEIPVWGDFPEAESLRVELELLQPERFADAVLGDDHVHLQDVAGAAWFDDIVVMQAPRIDLSTSDPTNIIPHDQEPMVNVLIRDLTGDALTAVLRVTDLDGNEVDRWERAIGSGRTSERWRPAVERYGWYRVTLTVRNDAGELAGREVGMGELEFVWTGPGPGAGGGAARDVRRLADRERFGLIAEELHPALLGLAADLVERSDAGAFEIPLWSARFEPGDGERITDALIPVVDRIRSQGRKVSFGLPVLPDSLAAVTRQDVEDVLGVFATDAWQPYLTHFLDRFGQRVSRWRLGKLRPGLGDNEVGGEDAAEARRDFAMLVPGPELIVPWPATEHRPAFAGGREALRGFRVTWPAWLSSANAGDLATRLAQDEEILGRDAPAGSLPTLAASPTLLATAKDSALPDQTVVFEPIRGLGLSPRARADELCKRVIEYWRHVHSVPDPIRGHRHRAALRQPWRFTEERRPRLLPEPELAAWRGLAHKLMGRVVLDRLPTEPGFTAYLLGPAVHAGDSTTGAIVIWRNDDRAPGLGLEMFLGDDEIVASDVFGNTWPIEPGSPGDDTEGRVVHRVEAGRSPVFVEGIDTKLVHLLSLVRVEDSFLRAMRTVHEREIVLDNPFDRPVSGTLVIVEPGGRGEPGDAIDRSWQIRPRQQRFSIAAGGTTRLPIDVSFDAAQEAGEHDFVLDMALIADRDYGWVRVLTPVEIGLEELDMELSYDFVPTLEGPDVSVTVRVVNTGDRQATLTLTMFAPGFSRQTASVTDLRPGEQAISRFLIEGAIGELQGRRVSVRVTDANTGARLSKSLVIE